jgi:hypothetical protein
MKHVHISAHPENHCILDSGGHYEVCDCGAVRKVDKEGKPDPAITGGRFNAKNDKAGWHTCDLCSPTANKA